MSFPVVLTLQAREDFDLAADWYQDHADQGLRFTSQVRDTLTRIGKMPELHHIVHRDVRRARVLKYPYYLYYRVGSDQVQVIAIVHARRDPSVWKNRV